jgi:plastocyanin
VSKALFPVVGSALFGAGLVAVALAGEPSRTTTTVDMRDFVFEPAAVEVAVGDTIVWVNRDVVPHTATAETGSWDSGEMRMGARWAWVAEHADTVEYVCAYHPSMRGTIVVR